MNWESFLKGAIDVTNGGIDVMKFLNQYIFGNIGTVVDVIKKVIDFFKNLFEGDTLTSVTDFFKAIFSGDFSAITDPFKNLSSGGLSGVTDFFKNLF